MCHLFKEVWLNSQNWNWQNVWKGLIYYLLSSVRYVHAPHYKVCLCIQSKLKHKWTVNFVFTKAFTAVLPLSFCWGQQRVSTYCRVWHPDAVWILGQRLSAHWKEEGGSVTRLKTCLFDIAFPHHLTALSISLCKAGNSVIQDIQTLNLYVCISVLAHL